MPRVAVLLPARDAARTVRAAAASILRQTFRDLALVAVDDGSRDGTAEALERVAGRDRRLKLLRGPGEGIAGALNRALAAADAEVIARMDADDVAHPARLARQLAALAEDPGLAAAGSRVRLFPRRDVRPGMARYAAWLNGLTSPALCARDLFVEAPLVHPAAAIRATALRAAGGWREGDFPEDYDLWLRLAAAGGRLTNLPATLLDWRESAGRLTRTDPRYALPRHLALKAHHLAAGPLAGRAEVAIWGAGETGRAFARALAPHGIRPALFLEVDRKKLGRRVAGAEVVGYEEAARARGLPLLVAVGAPGARPLIRAELAKQGFVEVRDFRCVA
ncbi:glycosyltransferase [Anaeromyxobacter paludicola]|uniref:Glycosyl transferase n=1 Tax=Anaeromyxobacter paludicola TaxID=2918171 RepID=A0ABM7XCF4_9BACT|nr:glycosyltransferase [Anaeromyxobacter paludicola]BDG09548.1 glycosyl transferase [Anaeromyxobacter paludicola]